MSEFVSESQLQRENRWFERVRGTRAEAKAPDDKSDSGFLQCRFLAQIFKKCFIKFVLQLIYSYICDVMGTKEKLIERFKTLPSDFTFDELERLLGIFGYKICNKGRTSGSRVIFKNEGGSPIMLHKPHPGNIVKEYALKQVLEELKNRNLI